MQSFINIVIVLPSLHIVGSSPSAYGHSKEKHSKPDSTQSISGETAAADSVLGLQGTAREEPYEGDVKEALTEHLHNKIVHLPIGFALASFALSILGLRWKELQDHARWLIVVAGLASILAYISGVSQANAFAEGPKRWVVELHETLGAACWS